MKSYVLMGRVSALIIVIEFLLNGVAIVFPELFRGMAKDFNAIMIGVFSVFFILFYFSLYKVLKTTGQVPFAGLLYGIITVKVIMTLSILQVLLGHIVVPTWLLGVGGLILMILLMRLSIVILNAEQSMGTRGDSRTSIGKNLTAFALSMVLAITIYVVTGIVWFVRMTLIHRGMDSGIDYLDLVKVLHAIPYCFGFLFFKNVPFTQVNQGTRGDSRTSKGVGSIN